MRLVPKLPTRVEKIHIVRAAVCLSHSNYCPMKLKQCFSVMITRLLAYESGKLRYLNLSLEFFLEACEQD